MQTGHIRVELAAKILAAYLSHNQLRPEGLPSLIRGIFTTLRSVAGPNRAEAERLNERPKPAPIKRSVAPDHITCLEDGMRFKSLKRHLQAKHGLTPDQYRAKWGLPNDYPMVTSAYSDTRSALARHIGLGQNRNGVPNRPGAARTVS